MSTIGNNSGNTERKVMIRVSGLKKKYRLGKIGARGSKLYETLRKGHNGVELTDEEMRRLVLFMDASGAYISHDFQAEAQCFGGVVEPKLQ